MTINRNSFFQNTTYGRIFTIEENDHHGCVETYNSETNTVSRVFEKKTSEDRMSTAMLIVQSIMSQYGRNIERSDHFFKREAEAYYQKHPETPTTLDRKTNIQMYTEIFRGYVKDLEAPHFSQVPDAPLPGNHKFPAPSPVIASLRHKIAVVNKKGGLSLIDPISDTIEEIPGFERAGSNIHWFEQEKLQKRLPAELEATLILPNGVRALIRKPTEYKTIP